MEQQSPAPRPTAATTLPVVVSPEAKHNLVGFLGLLMKIDRKGADRGKELMITNDNK